MNLTEKDLLEERTRAIKEHTPMQIQQCRECGVILPILAFDNSKRFCKKCSRKQLKQWLASTEGKKDKASRTYYGLKRNVKHRGSKLNLTRTEFKKWFDIEIKDGVCFYCQQKLDPSAPYQLNGVTIDRMDNTKGYEIGNIVLACRRCNIIKGSWFSFEDMIEIAEKYFKGAS